MKILKYILLVVATLLFVNSCSSCSDDSNETSKAEVVEKKTESIQLSDKTESTQLPEEIIKFKAIEDDKTGKTAKGQNFKKISITGEELPDTAEKWSCVLDNTTGLLWEVKSSQGLHFEKKLYRWGGKGVSKIALGVDLNTIKREEKPWDETGDRFNDWDQLVDGSNNEKYCGRTNWRVPNLYELSSLVYCSNAGYDLGEGCKNNPGFKAPTINTKYFPNTSSAFYWTSSPYVYANFHSWLVNFGNGYSNDYSRKNLYRVRLVSGNN